MSEFVLIDMVSLIKETDFFICLVATDAATGASSFTSSTGASSFTSSTGASSFTSSTGASSFGGGASLAATLSPPAHELSTSSTETPDACALASADLCTRSTGAFNNSATLFTKSLIAVNHFFNCSYIT